MRASAVVWSLIAGLVSTAVPLHAQRVEAGVGYSSYRRPTAHRVVVVERPRIVVVERIHRHQPAKHWARRGYRPVTIYYWDGRYYDRRVGHRHGVRTIVVWERNGRYYHDCDDEHRRQHEHWDD